MNKIKFNEVYLGDEGREKLLNGVNIISDAVASTLGAKGRNVIINRGPLSIPHVTKDGVTVARSIILKDPIENMGALLIKDVAGKTVSDSGDGTTSSSILAQSIINRGDEVIKSMGYSPIDVKSGIDKAVEIAVKSIASLSRGINSDDEIGNIATISANNDPYIGGLIKEAYSKIGKDGLIMAEDSKSNNTYIEVVSGMRIEQGLISPYLVTDTAKMKAELEDVMVLMVASKISSAKLLLPILEYAAKTQKPLLIISAELEGEALATCTSNHQQGNIKVAAINCPSVGDDRKHLMDDIAAVTGGVYISEEKGLTLHNWAPEMLGYAKSVSVSRKDCILSGANSNSEEVDKRCSSIKDLIKDEDGDYAKQRLKKRLSNLTNGVAVVYVGGMSETEIAEKKDRVDDALCATRSAIEEGYVAGGGVTFLEASDAVKDEMELLEDGGIKAGMEVVRKSLMAPFAKILMNAGVDFNFSPPDDEYGFGYNVKTNKVENFFETGVIDPTKVLRVALENAASVAATFLTTECVVSDLED